MHAQIQPNTIIVEDFNTQPSSISGSYRQNNQNKETSESNGTLNQMNITDTEYFTQ
jgi:hypothetical protein